MSTSLRKRLLPLAVLVAASPLLGSPVTSISVRPLDYLPGGTFAEAYAVNDAGVAVGSAQLPVSDGVRTYIAVHAVRWASDGSVRDLGTLPGGTYSIAQAINGSGAVVGSGDIELNGVCCFGRPFLWMEAGGMRALPVPSDDAFGGYGEARAINASGQVAGHAVHPVGEYYEGRATLWEADGSYTDLGTLGGGLSYALAINDDGQAAGYSYTASGYLRAFRWTPEEGIQDLGVLPGGRYSAAFGINTAGQVTGYSEVLVDGRFEEHAFLWTPEGGMRDLGTPPLPGGWTGWSSGWSLDDEGRVSGYATFLQANGVAPIRAAVWAAGTWTDLGPAGAAHSLGRGMNNRGEVAGFYRDGPVFRPALWSVSFGLANRSPSASVGGPYSGSEGSAVTLDLGGSDPDGDPLTYSWNLGDGTTGSGSTPPGSHSYGDNGVYEISLTVEDGRGGTDTRTTTATIANVAPSVSASGPASAILLGASTQLEVSFSDPADVRDAPFTATIDCGNGAGVQSLATISSPFAHSCSYDSVGSKTVTVVVTDKDGDSGSKEVAVSVIYDWAGFFRPVENRPTLNVVKAGRAIPVKFSLGGAQGLGVLAAGSPAAQKTACDASAVQENLEETVTAGSSSLSYDPASGQYTYVWKTESTWAGGCRRLSVTLIDGTTHTADFRFIR